MVYYKKRKHDTAQALSIYIGKVAVWHSVALLLIMLWFFIGIYHYSQHKASDTGGILYYIQNKSFSLNSALYDRYQDYNNRYLHSKTQKHINNVL